MVGVAGTDHKQIMSDIGMGGTGPTVAGTDHKQMSDIGVSGTGHTMA